MPKWQELPQVHFSPPEEWVETLCIDLAKETSLKQLATDPYWPKWNTPWWKMLLLCEMGAAQSIPQSTIEALCTSVEKTYLDFFPLVEEELPQGIDPYRNIVCHCALGCLYQMLHLTKTKVDERFPWMRPWFLKYQLPDGGLNCDEAVYTKERPHSSFLSTLPCLEAVLFTRANSELTQEEISFLDKGAQYLLKRELCCSISKGCLISKQWLKATFPRYYFYDVLRGLRFIAQWSKKLQREVPEESVSRAIKALLDSRREDGLLAVYCYPFVEEGSLVEAYDKWTWCKKAATFPLLDKVPKSDEIAQLLTEELSEALTILHLS